MGRGLGFGLVLFPGGHCQCPQWLKSDLLGYAGCSTKKPELSGVQTVSIPWFSPVPEQLADPLLQF